MNKTHFAESDVRPIACSVTKGRSTPNPSRVTCRNCQAKPTFQQAKDEQDRANEAAFWNQTPREFREPWGDRDSIIVCKVDGGTLFRDAGRSCMGHYQDYKCASCGTVASRLTETGMSF